MTNLRKIELKMIEDWNNTLNRTLEFEPKQVILCEYDMKYAVYIIDNTKYKLTKKGISIIEVYND